MADNPPTLHVLAGPNGAGKSTLYETSIKDRHPNAEFVNADLLARDHYGHNAVTLEQSEKGQELANARRAQLMAEGKSLVTESTFSHPSKLELIREAHAAGYRVFVHHVNVRSVDVSIARVQARVEKGGHPVPEQKIRDRYERNQALIKQAVKMADRAVVWDNSHQGKPPTRAVQFERGEATWASKEVPAWARELYSAELQHFSQTRLNPAAASFAEAKKIVEGQEPGARLHIARPGRYRGPIVGESSLHLVQKLQQAQGTSKEAGSYVAHFKKVLQRIPEVGKVVEIAHAAGKISAVTMLDQQLTAEALKLSLKGALALAKRVAGDKARITEPERGKSYAGPVLGQTEHHVVQGGKGVTEFVAHRKAELEAQPKVGNLAKIDYPTSTKGRATVDERSSAELHKQPAERDRDR